jgi:hypothetical protein
MRTNNTPFSDVCSLIALEKVYDASGHYTTSETAREVFCSISDGVVRTEYYEALKSGVKLSATAEVYADDYASETILEHNGTRYNIQRIYPTGYGTLELSLTEVIR